MYSESGRPGLRPVGFINLPMGEKKRPSVNELSIAMREKAAGELQVAMLNRVKRMNGNIRERISSFGERGLLTPEGRVDMRAFSVGNGGPYADERIREHADSVARYDLTHSGALEEGILKRHGGDAGHVLDEYRRKRKFHDGDLGEGAAFCVLNRFLGDRFLIVRTAEYDDYEHLVDFMVVDMEKGGKPVCAIDEIVGGENSGGRAEKKKERLKSGMRLRYGVSAKDDGSLSLGEFDQLPGIYAAIERGDLKALFESGADLSSDEDEPSEAERTFFEHIIGSIRNYVDGAGLPPDSPVHELLRAAERVRERRSAEVKNEQE